MNYDFAGMCVDQNAKLEKRLGALCKVFLKEYMFALDIINDSGANERRGEISVSLSQVLETAAQKSRIAFQSCSNDVIGILEQNIRK